MTGMEPPAIIILIGLAVTALALFFAAGVIAVLISAAVFGLTWGVCLYIENSKKRRR